MVHLVRQAMRIDVLTYQWQDRRDSNSHSQHKSDKDKFVLIGYM